MKNKIINIINFILMFLILVIVHEMGHIIMCFLTNSKIFSIDIYPIPSVVYSVNNDYYRLLISISGICLTLIFNFIVIICTVKKNIKISIYILCYEFIELLFGLILNFNKEFQDLNFFNINYFYVFIFIFEIIIVLYVKKIKNCNNLN